ncbi:MAG: hypothetical protein ACHQYP_08045 [Nitrospiria bacterium]
MIITLISQNNAPLNTSHSDQTPGRTTDLPKNGNTDISTNGSVPNVLNEPNYSLSSFLKLQFMNNINDTTNAILKNLRAQLDGNNIVRPVSLNLAEINSNSLKVGQAISNQGDTSLVQTDKTFLQKL